MRYAGSRQVPLAILYFGVVLYMVQQARGPRLMVVDDI
jgi:hypothetical protein